MSEYELVFVVDPRLADEEVVGLSDAVKEILATYDAEILKEESWGKRKLAYPIRNLTEGKYMLLRVNADSRKSPFVEIEQRLQQNDNILRYLTVRVDEGRLRERGDGSSSSTVEHEEES